jgi:hypothetical protein
MILQNPGNDDEAAAMMRIGNDSGGPKGDGRIANGVSATNGDYSGCGVCDTCHINSFSITSSCLCYIRWPKPYNRKTVKPSKTQGPY